MGATISLNGHVLGQATNQFLRYAYPVGADRISATQLTPLCFGV